MHRITNHSSIRSQHSHFVFWRFEVQFLTHKTSILSSTAVYQLYQTNTSQYIRTLVTQLDSMLVYQDSSHRVVLHKQNSPLMSTTCKTFWDVTLCCWVRCFQHFKELWSLHVQGHHGIHFLDSTTLEKMGPQSFRMSGTTHLMQCRIPEGMNRQQLNIKLPQTTHILWQTTKQYMNVEQWEGDLPTVHQMH